MEQLSIGNYGLVVGVEKQEHVHFLDVLYIARFRGLLINGCVCLEKMIITEEEDDIFLDRINNNNDHNNDKQLWYIVSHTHRQFKNGIILCA